MSITAILLDAGGTIVFPNFARIAAELSRDTIVDPDRLARADARIRFELDRPETIATTTDRARFRWYMDALAREAGRPGMPDDAFERLDTFHRTNNLWDVVPPGVPEALERLRARYRLGVITNSNGSAAAKLERAGLAHFFEVIVDSQLEGVEKPDPRIFQIALDRMGLTAAETAYIGDLYHVDVVGALAAGLTPTLLDPFDLHAHRAVARIRTLADWDLPGRP